MNLIDSFHEFLDCEHEDLPYLHTHKEVCTRCRGEGTLGGYPGVYTSDDFAEDPDFFDEYRAYTRTCEDCGGLRVIDVVDRENTHPDTLSTWDAYCADVWESYRIEAQERSMGA